MEFCEGHMKLMDDISEIKTTVGRLDSRVNGSIDKIENHLASGQAWRFAIVGTMLTIALQVITFAYLWGCLTKQVTINTDRITQIEELHPRAISGR